MNTIADLNEAMEPKFEELGAQDIFEQLKLGNIPEARELKEQFEGDEERLGQLWRSYTITRETHKEQNRRYNYSDYTSSEDTFKPALLARDILKDYSFITLKDSGQILVYKNGWWQPHGQKVIKEEANERLGREYRRGRVTNVVSCIEEQNYTDRQKFQPPERKINVKNSVYDLENGELVDHDPKYNFTFKIDYDYDSGAECPNIDQFLSELTETEEDKEKLYEIIAYSLLPSNPFNKAAMLAGSGSNGKTVLLDMLKTFIGREHIVNKSLQDLQGGFDAHHLYGKLGMLDDDLPPTRLQSARICSRNSPAAPTSAPKSNSAITTTLHRSLSRSSPPTRFLRLQTRVTASSGDG